MKYLVLEKINDSYYLIGSKAFGTEEQAYKMVDLQRDCNPSRFYQVVSILEEENLEVVNDKKQK